MKARENPFRSERIEAMPFRFPEGDDMASLLHRLGHFRGRGAIVGPHGSGKTTLMRDLDAALDQRGMRVRHHRLTQADRRIPHSLTDDLRPHDAVLLDSAGLMGPWAWRRFEHATRAAGMVIITAHAPGRLPTLIDCRTSPALLRSLLDELASGAPPTSYPHLTESLWRQHRGNLHAVFRRLYLASS